MNAATVMSSGVDFARRWYHNPIGFFDEVLGLEPWSKMIELGCAIRDNSRVACRAGQKVSKTTTLAATALWWWTTRKRAQFIYTSSSARQVRNGAYQEVQRLYREARVPLGAPEWLHDSPEAGLRSRDGRQIVGFSSDTPEKFLGLSGENLFLAIDEASGVPVEIAQAMQGNLAGGGKMLLTGNPTRTTGYFFDAFHSKRALWRCMRISSTESPNVTGELGVGRRIPGLAMPEYIEEAKLEYGEESAPYKIKILGEFARQAEDAFIQLALVEAAKDRWTPTPAVDNVLWIGVDPARYGNDSSVAMPCRGLWVGEPLELRQQDNVVVAQRVLELVEAHRRPHETPVHVNVDQSNNNGVADILRRYDHLEVHDILAQEVSPDPKYSRRRDHVWACAREWLRQGAIPDSARLMSDLLAPRYDWDERGRVKVESKRDLKKRLDNRSTDFGDAFALAVYRAPRTESGNEWDPIFARTTSR